MNKMASINSSSTRERVASSTHGQMETRVMGARDRLPSRTTLTQKMEVMTEVMRVRLSSPCSSMRVASTGSVPHIKAGSVTM